MDSTYHEAFWVAVAAATPVIVVGYLVVFERLVRYEPKLPPEKKYVHRTLTVSTKDGLKTIRRARRRRSPASLFTNIVMVIGMFLPMVGLTAALGSLANEKDDSTIGMWSNFLLFDLFLLLIASLVSVGWQQSTKTANEGEAPPSLLDDTEES